MIVHGYKAFASDGTNSYGTVFPVGKYHVDGKISFGPRGNGFHFAKRMEDTIRYGRIDDSLGDVLIAEVIGSGAIEEGEDSYGGFYDLYSASDIDIIRYLDRSEIIYMALQLPDYRMVRFVSYFRLTDEEISLFYGKYVNVDLAIDYYQRGMKDVYDIENVRQRYLNNVKIKQLQ